MLTVSEGTGSLNPVSGCGEDISTNSLTDSAVHSLNGTQLALSVFPAFVLLKNMIKVHRWFVLLFAFMRKINNEALKPFES